MRSNSGSGKSKNNLHDPTMKELERKHRKSERVAPTEREPMDETSDA
jgi:hypothetical protein